MKPGLQLLVALLLFAGMSGCEPRSDSNPPIEVPLSADEELLRAVNQGDIEAAIRALQDGADPNFVRQQSAAVDDELSLLQRAVTRGDVEMARTLIANQADVNKSAGGTTPLHVAITMLKVPSDTVDREARIELIKLLLDHDADVNALNRLDRTPVDMADSDVEVVGLLKARGGMSTAERQDRELEDIESQGGGLIGQIPDSVEDLKRHEEELGRKNGLGPRKDGTGRQDEGEVNPLTDAEDTEQ